MAKPKSKKIKPPIKKVEVAAPKVSVILTSYNHEKYIAAAIESVLNQTFTDFEFLIFDDGSKDNSREIIKSFDDPRIKTFLYEKNRGPHIAIQECLNSAQGKYIAMHHSDDLWREDKLQKQVEFLDANENFSACFTWVDFIDENGEHYELPERHAYYKIFDQKNRSREQWLHDLFFKGNFFCHPSLLIRNTKNLLEIDSIKGLWQLSDYSEWIRLLLRTELYVMTERLTFFRLRRKKQDNTSADRPDTIIRSEMELYRILREYRSINDPKEFVKIFPEAKPYIVDGNILPQFALAKILQQSDGAARKLLALDILFDLLNNKNTCKKLSQWYNYTELNFVRENAQAGIIYPATNIRYLQSSLYFDTGNGFSEENRIKSLVYVRQDGNFIAEFDVNADEVHALRFDPSEDEALSIKIISAQINGKNYELQANQPFKDVDGYQIFFTNDPQYSLNYSGTGNIHVTIQGLLSTTYDSLHILRNENLDLQAVRAHLIDDLQISRNETSKANSRADDLQGQVNSNLQQIDNLNGQIENLNGHINDLNLEIDSNRQQIESLHGNIDDLNEEIFSNQKQIENLNQQVNSNLQQINDLNGQINFNHQQIDGLQSHLNEIYSSRGYKFLQKYYALRDKLLPKGSTRRLIVKNLAWMMFNPKKTLSLINRDNLGKVISTLRHGGLRQLMIRSDNKLNSPAVTNIEKPETISYGNSWLDEKIPYTVPSDVIVDIIIPIYNAADFTKKCIESVFENTDVPFNLYLIDDCSPDERINSLMIDIAFWTRPKLLRHLDISHNEENLGFIGTVNRGFEMTKNNVVLLNTDTEVPPNWLSRLSRPMLEDEKVASVTPFSNSAEICSFPTICTNNDLPNNLTVSELDKILERYGEVTPCEMPTGIGFCMLMRRECIEKFGVFDTIFGKGYGEENEWCRRTAAQGYKHVHVKNLFVYHKHGASFAERVDKSKKQRMAENLAILNERYPDYDVLVQKYIHEDPAGANRRFMYHCALAKSSVQGVIFMNHSLGGGATVYQNRLIAQLQESWRVYEMEPLADGRTLLVKDCNGDIAEKIAEFDLNAMNADEFKELLAALNISWLYINQLVTYPVPKILDWIVRAEVPYTFFGHDFFAVCPRCHFLKEDMNYCGAETNLRKCKNCLKLSDIARINSANISEWRNAFQKFLTNAKEIIVPSQNTADLFQRYYENLPITVREHSVYGNLTKTFREEFAREKILTVAAVGSIGIEKGSKIIYSLAEKLEKRNLPLRLLVIGITNLNNTPYKSESGKFEITGAYDNKEISNLLAKYKVAIVFTSSIIPETYSYTTTEAMLSGYPVMVFPLGAPADRVKRTGGGWILSDINEDAVLTQLKKLVANREEIIDKAKKILLS